MKSTLAIIALTATAASAFTVQPSSRTTTSLGMGGFLEGKGKRITIRDDEDAAMWFDDGSGGRVPSEPKKPEPKKPAEPKKKSGGFKFPWDK